MDLTVVRTNQCSHSRSRTASLIFNKACFSSIDCTDITSGFKNPLSCLNFNNPKAPLTPRRSILQLTEVKRIAEQSGSRSRPKKLRSKQVGIINLQSKQVFLDYGQSKIPQTMSSNGQSGCPSQNIMKRSISIASGISGQSSNPLFHSRGSYSNILRQINLYSQNQTILSESTNVKKRKIIKSKASQQDNDSITKQKSKRYLRIVSSQKKLQIQNISNPTMQRFYQTFAPNGQLNPDTTCTK